MKIVLVILLVLAGIIFLLLELFLIPGFGISGIAGFLSLTGAVYIAYVYLTPIWAYAGHITLLSSLLLTGLAVYWFFHKRIIEKVALGTTINSHVTLAPPGKKIADLQKHDQQPNPQYTQKQTEV